MKEQSREQQYLQVFQNVTRLISVVLDHQQVMDTIDRSLPDLLNVDACTIRLLEPRPTPLFSVHHIDHFSRARFRIARNDRPWSVLGREDWPGQQVLFLADNRYRGSLVNCRNTIFLLPKTADHGSAVAF